VPEPSVPEIPTILLLVLRFSMPFFFSSSESLLVLYIWVIQVIIYIILQDSVHQFILKGILRSLASGHVCRGTDGGQNDASTRQHCTVHGSLSRAGKVKNQTPKGAKQ